MYRRGGWYDQINQAWRHNPGGKNELVFATHDQLLGLLAERRFEMEGIDYQVNQLTTPTTPLPEVLHLPRRD